ncbi:MAG: hypothetical protein RMK94_16465, partial [Armatimonadota bacterium]|nr:hypothetical protein [Armatimonadota bacterium]
QDVGGLKQDASSLKQDVGGLEKDVSGLKQDVGGLKQDASSLKQDVGGLKQDVSGLKQDVGGLKQDASSLKQDVGGLKQDVSSLKQDVGGLKQDVSSLKQDVGRLKGMSKEISFRQKAGSYLGVLLKGGKDASELVNEILDEAEQKGLITSKEADYVRAADLLWFGLLRRGKFAGEQVIVVAEISWVADEEDVKRAIEKAQILKRAGVWAVPFVSGEEWVSEDLKQRALQKFVFCADNGKIEPDRENYQTVENFLVAWKPW